MKSDTLTIAWFVVSLILGFFITYKIIPDMWEDSLFEKVCFILIGAMVSLLALTAIGLIVSAVEPVQVSEHSGVIVNRLIKGESKEDNVIIINGVPHTTTSTTPESWMLKVRDDETNNIVTIPIDENQFYNDTTLVVGAKINYELEFGTLTGDENFNLK